MKAFDIWAKNKMDKESEQNNNKSTIAVPTISIRGAPSAPPTPKPPKPEEFAVEDDDNEQKTEEVKHEIQSQDQTDPQDIMVQELFEVVEKYIKIEDYRVIYYNLHFVANQLINPQTDDNEN